MSPAYAGPRATTGWTARRKLAGSVLATHGRSLPARCWILLELAVSARWSELARIHGTIASLDISRSRKTTSINARAATAPTGPRIS